MSLSTAVHEPGPQELHKLIFLFSSNMILEFGDGSPAVDFLRLPAVVKVRGARGGAQPPAPI